MDYAKFYPLMGIQASGSFSGLWIYQTYNRYKRVCRYYYPENPRTANQQSNRGIFYDAIKNWQGFDESTKNFYNEWAIRRPLSGYNRYISLYLKANKDMIIYWQDLQKNSSDPSKIPDYIYSQIPNWVPPSSGDLGDSLISGHIKSTELTYCLGRNWFYPIKGLEFGVYLVKPVNVLISSNINFIPGTNTPVRLMTKIVYPTGSIGGNPYNISSITEASVDRPQSFFLQHIIHLYAGFNLVSIYGARWTTGGTLMIDGSKAEVGIDYVILK